MTDDLKLFHVDITYSVMVAAKDARNAEILADRDLRGIIKEELPEVICAGQVTKVGDPWKGSLPWGASTDELPCEHFTGEL